MVPRFGVHSSGSSSSTPASRSCTDMPVPPPVEMLITTSLRCLMPDAYSAKIFGSADGLPSFGSRACRCRTAAPAPAAATPWSTTSSMAYGSDADMDGAAPAPTNRRGSDMADLSRRQLFAGAAGVGLTGSLAACGSSGTSSPSTSSTQAAGTAKRGGNFRLGVTGGGAKDIMDGQNIITK